MLPKEMSSARLRVATISSLWFAGFLFLSLPVQAQAPLQEVSICDLNKNAQSLNKKTVKIRGWENLEFEDFSLYSKNCETRPGIWLRFGGDVATIEDANRRPGTDLKMDGISYGLRKDAAFRKFYALITARGGEKPAYQVEATLTGVFFAGDEENGHSRGYGHFSCCHLFIISEVSNVESVPPVSPRVSGTVASSKGEPLSGVKVISATPRCCRPQRQETTTDPFGHFKFSDSGQVLRFEKINFRPLTIVVEPVANGVRVTLEDSKPTDWVVPDCPALPETNDRIGFTALFDLPEGLTSEKRDEDGVPGYFIMPSADPPMAGMIISSDPAGLWFHNDTEMFLGSASFEQRWIKDATGGPVGIDTHGRWKTGDPWRWAEFLGHDVANYIAYSSEATRLVENAVDSVCLARH